MLKDTNTLLGVGALALIVYIAHRANTKTPEQIEADKARHRSL